MLCNIYYFTTVLFLKMNSYKGKKYNQENIIKGNNKFEEVNEFI